MTQPRARIWLKTCRLLLASDILWPYFNNLKSFKHISVTTLFSYSNPSRFPGNLSSALKQNTTRFHWKEEWKQVARGGADLGPCLLSLLSFQSPWHCHWIRFFLTRHAKPNSHSTVTKGRCLTRKPSHHSTSSAFVKTSQGLKSSCKAKNENKVPTRISESRFGCFSFKKDSQWRYRDDHRLLNYLCAPGETTNW